jgi:mRNA-degrading endonuclease YafQ of YafQ-DinJ toxin-antitoxin module
MRNLVWDASFKRAFRRRTRLDPTLQERILEVLAPLATDPFEPALKTHKLRGQLAGLWACWVEYDGIMRSIRLKDRNQAVRFTK